MGRLLTAIGLLIAIILAGGFIAPLFIDWNSHKAAIEQEASRLSGMPVAIDGQVDARLLPVPMLDLRMVRIGRVGSRLAVGQARMEFSVTSLLTGQLVVSDALLIGPRLTIAPAEAGQANPPQLDIATGLERLDIRNGVVEVLPSGAGAPQVSRLDMVVQASSLAGPWKGEGQAEIGGVPLLVSFASGKLGPEGLALKLFANSADRNISADFEGLLGGAAGLSPAKLDLLSFKGKGRLRRADLPNARIEAMLGVLAGRVTVSEIVLQPADDMSPLAFKGEVSLRSGAPWLVEGALSLDQLDLDRFDGGVVGPQLVRAMPLLAAGRGRLGLDVAGLTLLGGQLQDLKLVAELVDGRVRLTQGEVRLPGKSTLKLSGDVTATSFDGPVDLRIGLPGAFAAWLGGQGVGGQTGGRPAGAMPPLSVQGRVNASGGQVSTNGLTLGVGAARIRLDADLLGSETARQLRLRMSGDDIDLEPLLAVSQGLASRLPPMGHLLVDANLRADKLHYRGISGQGAELIVKGDEAGWTFAPMRVRLAGGALAGRVYLGRDGARDVTIEGNFERMDGLAHALLELLPGDGMLTNLRMRGAAFSPLKLSGEYKLPATGEGRIALSGTAGGSRIEASGVVTAFPAALADLRQFRIGMQNNSSARLMTQLGAQGQGNSVRGAGRFELSGVADGPTHRLKLEALLAGVTITGAGTSGKDGLAIKVSGKDAAGFLSLLGLPQWGNDPLSLGLDGRLTLDVGKTTLRIDTGEVAGQAFTGSLALADRRVSGVLALDSFDPVAVHCLALGLPACGSFDGGWSMLAPTRMLAPKLALDLDLSIRTLTLPVLGAVQDVRLGLVVQDGSLASVLRQGTAHGGQLRGQVTSALDGEMARVAGDLVLDGVPLQGVLWQGVLTGDGALSVRFSGAGRSQAQLIASLTGAGQVRAPKGATLRGVDPGLGLLARAQEGAGKPLNAADVQALYRKRIGAARLALAPFDVPFSIDGGVMRINALSLEGEAARISGRGALDLGRWRMDGEWSIEDKAEAARKARLRYGLVVRGVPDAPLVQLDPRNLLEGLSLLRIERDVEQLERMQGEIDARDKAASPVVTPQEPAPPQAEPVPQLMPLPEPVEIAPR